MPVDIEAGYVFWWRHILIYTLDDSTVEACIHRGERHRLVNFDRVLWGTEFRSKMSQLVEMLDLHLDVSSNVPLRVRCYTP